jgi:glycosyltransferase involved in cell wall biosynthesis
VMPSLHEGVPQVGLQALASGTPVIGSEVGGIPAIIQPGRTGWLTRPNHPDALADAIQLALASPDKARQMAAVGRAFVEAEHSLDGMLDRLETIYRRYLP